MPDVSALSLSGSSVQALAAQARNANGVLHLFQAGFNPTPTSNLAAFLDAEADFSGYAPITIAAWEDPFLLGASWATSALAQYFRYDSGAGTVNNEIGGWFLVLAGGALTIYGTFNPTRTISGDGQIIVVEPVEAFVAG